MAGMEGMIQGGLPVFDDKLFDDWKIRMKVVFSFQEVTEVIETSVMKISSKATEEEKKNHKLQ